MFFLISWQWQKNLHKFHLLWNVRTYWPVWRLSERKVVLICTGQIPTDWLLTGTPVGSGDGSVVRAPECVSKVAGSNLCRDGGRIFFSRVNFLCWLLFRYLFHSHVTAVACERPRSFCQKGRWQVTAKCACTLQMWLCMKWHSACVVWCTQNTLRWQQFHVAPAMPAL